MDEKKESPWSELSPANALLRQRAEQNVKKAAQAVPPRDPATSEDDTGGHGSQGTVENKPDKEIPLFDPKLPPPPEKPAFSQVPPPAPPPAPESFFSFLGETEPEATPKPEAETKDKAPKDYGKAGKAGLSLAGAILGATAGGGGIGSTIGGAIGEGVGGTPGALIGSQLGGAAENLLNSNASQTHIGQSMPGNEGGGTSSFSSASDDTGITLFRQMKSLLAQIAKNTANSGTGQERM